MPVCSCRSDQFNHAQQLFAVKTAYTLFSLREPSVYLCDEIKHARIYVVGIAHSGGGQGGGNTGE